MPDPLTQRQKTKQEHRKNTELYLLLGITIGVANGYFYIQELYNLIVVSVFIVAYLVVGKLTYDALTNAHRDYNAGQVGLASIGGSLLTAPIVYLYHAEGTLSTVDAGVILLAIPTMAYSGYRVYVARKLHGKPWLDMGMGEIGLAWVFIYLAVKAVTYS